MVFYKSIAGVYHKIFPLSPDQVTFTTDAFAHPGGLNLLDVGCGNGSLSAALSASFKTVTGIDLDETMIEKAKKDAGEIANLEFITLDMLEIDSYFHPLKFDCIICYGNTLVHLSTIDQIMLFFEKCFRLLTPKGRLLIQIINFDRILDKKINSLPTLENDDIHFIRNYRYHPEKHRIDFETILTIKGQGQVIKNIIPLFPVRQSEIEAALKNAGFSHIEIFGNFKREVLSSSSIPMVIKAG